LGSNFGFKFDEEFGGGKEKGTSAKFCTKEMGEEKGIKKDRER
jgi:hypothetical protein